MLLVMLLVVGCLSARWNWNDLFLSTFDLISKIVRNLNEIILIDNLKI
jgi:hypothetical protein